ncbi:glycosyltransferase family 2 protein [Natronospira bacteriovora]|uniref:Glycosyltransferase n=1 Tax=Natronospira bacteriovora TaxID=3069753 RepID=A0ABU0WAM0_9GAMM|nr:glycosyltransferase family 2 protein [Natronospira sp. AB-CW4]MDQ2069990.1 glycosyltransferase [Natronospira sp. AB-CW4]
MSIRCCALVPVYNQPERVAEVVAGLRAHGLECLLVDDGSDPDTAAVLRKVAAADAGVHLCRSEINRGKGMAVTTGLRLARARGFSHALQVDADGQHDLNDVPGLLRLVEAEPGALVSGRPRYDESVPVGRVFARYITHVWVWIETLSLRISDSMCGYRVYPVEASLAVIDQEGVGARMDFDTEIMVRLFWRGVPVRFLPTAVRYDTGSRSTFRLFRDNVRISWMHTRLVFGMLGRLPRLLFARRSGERHWSRTGERGSLLALRLSVLAFRLLGRRGMAVVLFPAAVYFLLFNARARRASMQYFHRLHALDPALPAPGWRNSFRHFWQFVQANINRVEAWSGADSQARTAFPDEAHFQALVDAGQGALFIGAHVGNLEVGRAIAARWPEVTFNALVYTANARRYNRAMQELNERFGANLILVEEIGADTALMLKSRVDAGEFVVIVGDRTPVAGDSPTVTAPFLGEQARFPVGPWVLAHVLACPVFFFFYMEDDDGGFRVFLEPVADRIRLPRKDRDRELQALTETYAGRLETLARQYPYQWYNFYDFWRDNGVQATPPSPVADLEKQE